MKLRVFAAALAALALCASAGAQQSSVPQALMAAIAATQSAKLAYAFDIDFSGAGANVRAHFNPNANPHVTLIQPAESQLNNGQRQVFNAMQHQLEGVSWCAGERTGNITNVRLTREDADTATYSFQPTRDSMRGQAAQYADRLRGELTITKANPDITAIHIFTPAAFDPIPFVHIANVDIAISCATAPNGRRYGAQTISQTTGSAFGQTINEHNVQRTSNLSAPS